MSWEALRLTSRAPSEVLAVLGPHGVEELIRNARNDCWREHPQETRTLPAVRKMLQEVFDRNIAVWRSIRKPTPDEFFKDLQPHQADHHIRQALVTCHMMLPRGHKSIEAVAKIVTHIFQRMLDAWEEDRLALTTGKRRQSRKPPAKSARKAPLRKKSARKR